MNSTLNLTPIIVHVMDFCLQMEAPQLCIFLIVTRATLLNYKYYFLLLTFLLFPWF